MIGKQSAGSTSKPKFKIVVLQAGFVFVARYTEITKTDSKTGEVTIDKLLLEDVQNVRVWGTTKGMGELRLGPTSETQLDICGDITDTPYHALIFTMEINQEPWEKSWLKNSKK